MLKVHHTQNKLAASLGLTIGMDGDEFVILNRQGVEASRTSDLKAHLAEIVAAAKAAMPKAPKPPKAAAPKKARKAAKRKARKSGDDEDSEGDEDEEDDDHSVVKSKYKAIYAKSEIKGTNDDAFAVAFHAATINEDGELDIVRVRAVARANKVDMSSYGQVTRGWQGRQRMTLGNILRGMVRHGVDVEIGSKTIKGAKVEPKPRKSRAKAK